MNPLSKIRSQKSESGNCFPRLRRRNFTHFLVACQPSVNRIGFSNKPYCNVCAITFIDCKYSRINGLWGLLRFWRNLSRILKQAVGTKITRMEFFYVKSEKKLLTEVFEHLQGIVKVPLIVKLTWKCKYKFQIDHLFFDCRIKSAKVSNF